MFSSRKRQQAAESNSSSILVADIGGTNSNFALFHKDKLHHLLHFASSQIKDFTNIIHQVLERAKKNGFHPNIACFAIAAPIKKEANIHKLTNLSWTINIQKIKAKTNLQQILVINDFVAIAYGLDRIKKSSIKPIKKGEKIQEAPCAILGAGTDLGKGVAIWNPHLNRHIPLASEGGHANLAVNSPQEFELLEFVKEKHHKEEVTWGDILSGRGLSTIYQFLSHYHKPTKYSLEIKQSSYDPSLISKYRSKDPLCKKTFSQFLRFYGRCAKSLALDTLAQGGVYIAGGIAAKNPNVFKEKAFIEEFIQSTKQKDLLKSIPVFLITDYNISLYGAAIAAKLK